MKITVTQEDIDEGTPVDPQFCPIGRAIRRVASNRNFAVRVRHLRVGKRLRLLPVTAAEFIRKYDHGIPVEPFTFSTRKF